MISPQKRTKFLIILIVIFFIFSLSFFQKKVKNFFFIFSSPIQKWIWKTGNSTSDFFSAIFESQSLSKENEELNLRIQELLAEDSALKELKKENENLREALGLGMEKEFRLNLSQIVSKDISQDYLTIDKGSKDGIAVGFPVITQQKVLVGKVSKVYDNFSRVQLITDKEVSFDAKIPEEEIYGLAKGKGNFKLFLDLIPKEKEIKVGDLIVTAALGGIYPKNLLLGEITQIKNSDTASFQEAEIKPAFNINTSDFLFVVTSFSLIYRAEPVITSFNSL